jgi:hypothetical protein
MSPEDISESHNCKNLKLENVDESHHWKNLKFEYFDESRHWKNLKFENFDESQLKMMRPGLVYVSCKDLGLN